MGGSAESQKRAIEEKRLAALARKQYHICIFCIFKCLHNIDALKFVNLLLRNREEREFTRLLKSRGS